MIHNKESQRNNEQNAGCGSHLSGKAASSRSITLMFTFSFLCGAHWFVRFTQTLQHSEIRIFSASVIINFKIHECKWKLKHLMAQLKFLHHLMWIFFWSVCIIWAILICIFWMLTIDNFDNFFINILTVFPPAGPLSCLLSYIKKIVGDVCSEDLLQIQTANVCYSLRVEIILIFHLKDKHTPACFGPKCPLPQIRFDSKLT